MSEQYMQALALANAARSAQRELRQDLYNGKLTMAQAMRDPRVSKSMTVRQLLNAQWYWGNHMTKVVCMHVGVSPDKLVVMLTDRQVNQLQERAKGLFRYINQSPGDSNVHRASRARARRVCTSCDGLFTSDKQPWFGVLTLCDRCEAQAQQRRAA